MTRPYERLTLQQVATYPRPGMAVPGRVDFTPDGRYLTYLFSAEGSLVRSLWAYDVQTGERSVLAGPPPASTSEEALSREEELRRERARMRELGVTDYQFAREAPQPVLLVPSGGSLKVSVAGGALEEIPGTEGALDARLSRDGSHVAFVRDGELHVAAIPAGPVKRLTEGAEDGLTNGVAEFIAQEELGRSEGFWWSPDGERLAYVRADSRHIAKLPIVHEGGDRVDVEYHRYPFAGDANAFVELGVIASDGGETRWLDLGPERDVYLARVAWTPGGVLTAQVLSRDQKTLRLLSFDADGRPSLLIEERGEPWVNLANDLRLLESGEVLWSSERTGFRHLYLYDEAGRLLRQLTDGDWVVTRVVRIDETARRVYFEGTREGALERHLYRVSLDGGEVERLTEVPGWHSAVVSPDGARFADMWHSPERAPSLRLFSTEGKLEATIYEDPEGAADSLGLQPPEFLTVPAADGTPLDGALYKPPGFQVGRKYPLIVSVYGGPHAQSVGLTWTMTVDLRAQFLAQQGFLVFKLDNRGSTDRGLAFEAHLARRFGTVEVEDQVAGVRHLLSLGIVDERRVGVYGWSYGGYMTCLCLMKAPEVFSVGVAGAPVTSWDGYDTGYTERYMSTPEDNPEGYREASALTYASMLEGHLLLVHGMVDENVHFRHTARLIVALTVAQKRYDLLVYPEERHMPRDAKGLEYMERRLFEYFSSRLS